MSHDLADFLVGVPTFAALDQESLAELAKAFDTVSVPDRKLILQQGTVSRALYLLRRGTVAVRVRRDGHRETVAELLPPSFFGEISFFTGRTCSADVEAVGPVEVATLTPEALAGLGVARVRLTELLLQLVAGRLHETVSGRATLHRPRTVLLRADDAFRAPLAFSAEMAEGLRDRSTGETLLVVNGRGAGAEPRGVAGATHAIAELPATWDERATRLEAWRREFRYTVFLERPEDRLVDRPPLSFDAVADLVAGGPALPPIDAPLLLLAADADRVRLEVLSGSRQLLRDADAAEQAFLAGRELPPRFCRTTRSLARAVAGRQVGLALGGGGACCWAHIGLLSVLEEAGIPIDMVAGCSMGSLVAALVSSGRSVAEMTAIADYWRTRYRWMVELRFWRMHLVSERGLRRALEGYFQDRELGGLELPFWANAVDVRTGEEVLLDRGRVTDTIRGSMTLPGSSPPFELGERLLIDAAMLAPIPVKPVRAMGAHFVIAMNVMPSMAAGTIPRYNPLRFFDILFRGLRISGHEIGVNRAVSDADVLLTPALETHSLLDFSRCHEIIRAGVDVTERHRDQIVAAYQGLVDARS
jgi:NTE family protein